MFLAFVATFAIIVACDNAPAGSPNIALYDVTGTKTAVIPGSTVDFGNVPAFSTPSRNFIVENTGTADLLLAGSGNKVVISGADAGDFNIPTQPPPSIPAGGSVTFDIMFTSTGSSTQKYATIGIASDDPDLANLSFNVLAFDQSS